MCQHAEGSLYPSDFPKHELDEAKVNTFLTFGSIFLCAQIEVDPWVRRLGDETPTYTASAYVIWRTWFLKRVPFFSVSFLAWQATVTPRERREGISEQALPLPRCHATCATEWDIPSAASMSFSDAPASYSTFGWFDQYQILRYHQVKNRHKKKRLEYE